MDNELEITELYDLDVQRHDGVENPASGFRFLVTKSAMPTPPADASEGHWCSPGCETCNSTPTAKESDPVEDATKDATESVEETSEVEDAAKETAPAPAPALSAEDVQEIVKAALAERESEAEKRIAALKSELDVLKATPIPGGPSLLPSAEQTNVKAKSEAMAKAAYHRRQAELTSRDRELSRYHVEKAAAFEAEAN